MSGCAGQAERPLQASWPQRPPGHCGSYRGETQPLMLMTIMVIMVTRYDADDLNDPLGNSRSHRSETQSHFLSIRQFSPLPIGHWTIQCVAFRAQFSRRFMFCPNPSVGLCEHIGVSHSPSIRSNQSVLWTLRPQLFTPSPSSHHQQSADLLFITALCSRK